MTKTRKKLNISPLPAQKEDYSHYEQTEVLWGRIVLAGVIAFVVFFAFIQLLIGTSTDEKPSVVSASSVPESVALHQMANISKSAPGELEAPVPNVLTPANTAASAVISRSAGSPTIPASAVSALTPTPETIEVSEVKVRPNVDLSVQETPTVEDRGLAKIEKMPIKVTFEHPESDPVRILHTGIKRAQLTSSLKDKLPTNRLGKTVSMTGEGIIKVVLFTEMHDMAGKTLVHHWFRNNEAQASVRVPIRSNKQLSSSSKFINQHMLGRWRVNVVDAVGTLHVQAVFDVIAESGL